jgi:hypothetical protein
LNQAGGDTPLTERILPANGIARALIIGVWAAVPFVRLASFAVLAPVSGVLADRSAWLNEYLPGAFLNAYLIVIVLIGERIASSQLGSISHLGSERTVRLTRLNGSALVAVALALLLTVLTEASQVVDFGVAAIQGSPLPFVAAFVLAFVIRLPQAVAFWTSVVSLVAIAEIGRHPVPGTYPEDRNLGLKGVGRLLSTLPGLYVAAFVPIFVFGTAQLTDLAVTIGLFVVGLAAMLLAVWRMHQRMAAERLREVSAANERYAAAYRRAAANPNPQSGAAIQTAQALLEGAQSIREWPFDDQTQRVVGLLATSVLTGVVVRVALLALGI